MDLTTAPSWVDTSGPVSGHVAEEDRLTGSAPDCAEADSFSGMLSVKAIASV